MQAPALHKIENYLFSNRRAALCGCQKQAASDQQPEQSLTDSDNNSKLENWNFGFIFCFNDVNMLKGIRGFAPAGLWPVGLTPRRE